MMFICTDNTIECHNMACNATNQCIHSFIRSFAVKRSCRLRSSNMLRTCIMEVTSSNELTSSSLSFEPVKLQIKRRLWGLLTYWRLISQHIIIISTSLYVTVTWNQLAHAHVIFVEFLLENVKCQIKLKQLSYQKAIRTVPLSQQIGGAYRLRQTLHLATVGRFESIAPIVALRACRTMAMAPRRMWSAV